jgi:hypothetical protein
MGSHSPLTYREADMTAQKATKVKPDGLQEYLVPGVIEGLKIVERPVLKREKHSYLNPLVQLIDTLKDGEALEIDLGATTTLRSEHMGLRHRARKKGRSLHFQVTGSKKLKVWFSKIVEVAK